MIPVTKPFIPPIEDYERLVQGIWKRNWLTNNGPLVKELEDKLSEYLGIENLLFLTNGTISIQLAIKALGISKEIITTPFSYVATTSSIVWEGCSPVFVDIDKSTFNIDPLKIEAAITPNTQAILATHCFGNPCNIDAIDSIAKKHNLKVIYDAAHCFGTLYKGKSIFEYGDVSTASFHATKLFHTVEGGAVFTKSKELYSTLSYMRNFGHDGPEKFHGIGINGKNSEFHAAMGIVNLDYVDNILSTREFLSNRYDSYLSNLEFEKQKIGNDTKYNFSYYPLIFESEHLTLKIKKALEKKEVFARRYFYPSLSKLPYTKGKTPNSDDIASRILCLPLYDQLSSKEQELVVSILIETQKEKK